MKRIEDLIIDKRIAILPVHVYGNSCDVDFF
ncbi:DegT/DnrJ/EryC1/StrS family aminotransferase [Fusobacterium animalis]